MYIQTEYASWYTTPNYQYWFRHILARFPNEKKIQSETWTHPPTSMVNLDFFPFAKPLTDNKISFTHLSLATDETGCRDKLDGISQRRLHADTCQHHQSILRHLHILLLAPTGGTTVTAVNYLESVIYLYVLSVNQLST